jgi:GxxExxY protein
VSLPVTYKTVRLDCGYRADLIVEDKVAVELKSIDQLTGLHKAQLLTYLRISHIRIGLLLNFNVEILKDGLVRLVC